MATRIMLRGLLTFCLMLLLVSVATSQEFLSIHEEPEHIGDHYYPQYPDCGPAEPIGISWTITFEIMDLSDWAFLYLEAVGVDPDVENYENKVFFNDQHIGNLDGYVFVNCNQWDTTFMVAVVDLLQTGVNEIRIESGYWEFTEEWDDFYVRNVRIYPQSVPVFLESWSRIKAVYR